MKNLKKHSKNFFIVLVVLIVAFIAVKSIHIKEVEICNIDFRTLKDGVYVGTHDSTLVKARVSVEVKNHNIQTIIINEHQTCLGKKAETIINKIIEKQSLQVDSIAGATVSSNTIKKAVEDALSNGTKK
ncbi:MAG: FMN-binding protein [Vallitalea sp.]|jgi:uncharacterized protein with FMN-binding domain|nr:FMN-binding protein [Vallitalea sp.]